MNATVSVIVVLSICDLFRLRRRQNSCFPRLRRGVAIVRTVVGSSRALLVGARTSPALSADSVDATVNVHTLMFTIKLDFPGGKKSHSLQLQCT